MFEYYQKKIISEHMLYANELAELFKIYSVNDIPYGKGVKAIIYDYINKHKISYEPYYYFSSRNKKLIECYPKYIYIPALQNFIIDNETNKIIRFCTIIENKKKIFNIKIKGE